MSQVPLTTLASSSSSKYISIPQSNPPVAVVVTSRSEPMESPACHIDKCHPKKVEPPTCHVDKCHVKKVEAPACHVDKCHPKKVEHVQRCCAKADEPGHHHHHHAWGWVGQLVIWLVIFTVLWWLILYSLKPSFVQTNGQVDTAKVLLYAVLAAAFTVLIVWLIKAAIARK